MICVLLSCLPQPFHSLCLLVALPTLGFLHVLQSMSQIAPSPHECRLTMRKRSKKERNRLFLGGGGSSNSGQNEAQTDTSVERQQIQQDERVEGQHLTFTGFPVVSLTKQFGDHMLWKGRKPLGPSQCWRIQPTLPTPGLLS